MQRQLISALIRGMAIAMIAQAHIVNATSPSGDALPTGEAVFDHLQPVAAQTAKLPAQPAPMMKAVTCHESAGPVLPSARRQTSQFGLRQDPINGGWRLHKGIDLSAPLGSPVLAATGGIVLRSGWAQGYGNLIVIDHGQGITTRYAHLERSLVHSGQSIALGQEIGLVGATGHATGSHLHFEIRLGDRALDPTRTNLSFCDPDDTMFDNSPAMMAPRLSEVPTRLTWGDQPQRARLPVSTLR